MTMRNVSGRLRHLIQPASMLLKLIVDAIYYLGLCLRPHPTLAAEVLFVRTQLALYEARQVKPRRATDATRIAMVWLSHCFNWRSALRIVKPETLTRWHRQGFRLFWRWKSKPGRPPLPQDLQVLIRRMALENPTWGQERMANALLLKLGLRVSPRTVRKYRPRSLERGPGTRLPSQRWATFVRNHAQAIVACDFCVAVTVTFRLLYVFVVIEHASRRLLQVNVTASPTAAWTLQQLREAMPAEHGYCFLLHDRDSIFSPALDQCIRHLGLQVLKTPVRTPVANALCERVLGTLRRECLDFVMPFTETHVRRLLQGWVHYYNTERPHMALGPGIPQPLPGLPAPLQEQRHRWPAHGQVVARPILGGLHHEYRLEEHVA